MDEELKQSILKTLCYFDVLDMPLTKEELYTWLWDYGYADNADLQISFLAFCEQLEQLEQMQYIKQKNGFYFFPGRQDVVEGRRRSVSLIEKKLKIAMRAAKKLRWIPFVRAMFVCNTVASASASDESDIDVFIVIRRGRMWLARFFVTTVLSLFGLRRTKKKIANKICLSFYITNDHFSLSDIKFAHDDIYLMYWIDQLIPVYDPEHLRSQIMKENAWVKKYVPHALLEYKLISRYTVVQDNVSKSVKKFFESMWGSGYGDMLESQAKGFQKKKMSFNRQSLQHASDTRVVVSDSMLKFHENDRREYYREEWRKRFANLNN